MFFCSWQFTFVIATRLIEHFSIFLLHFCHLEQKVFFVAKLSPFCTGAILQVASLQEFAKTVMCKMAEVLPNRTFATWQNPLREPCCVYSAFMRVRRVRLPPQSYTIGNRISATIFGRLSACIRSSPRSHPPVRIRIGWSPPIPQALK